MSHCISRLFSPYEELPLFLQSLISHLRRHIHLNERHPIFSGFLLIYLLWPSQSLPHTPLLLKCGLSIGLALGISSCTFFVWLVLLGTPNYIYTITELLFFTALIIILLRAIRNKKRASNFNFKTYPESFLKFKPYIILPVTFYSILTLSVLSFVLLSLYRPHGTGDAFGIWNMRATFSFCLRLTL